MLGIPFVDTILSPKLQPSECKKRELASENAYIFRVFAISSQHAMLLIDSCIRLVLNYFGKRRNGA